MDVPSEKNSTMTSTGVSLVSGTLQYTNMKDNPQTMAYIPKTPTRPMDFISGGRLYVTIMLLIQNVWLYIVEHIARAFVGKISEHIIFGIGPKPITKTHK